MFGDGRMATMTNSAISKAEGSTAVSRADVGLLILRVTLGIIFFAHGAQKLLGWFGGKGLFSTLVGFNEMGIPTVFGYLAIFAEFLGGLGLIFGVLTWFSALGIAITMLVAMLKVHWKGGFFAPAGIEYNLALLAMALCVMLVGAGSITLMSRFKRLPIPFFLK
jgi:putative oxidoreductase